MTKLSLFVQIPRLSDSPSVCTLMVQPASTSAPTPGAALTKVELNGDILQTVKQSSGYDGTVITFFLADLRYTFDTINPIQISQNAPTNCNPPAISTFPGGIPQPTNVSPTSFKLTLPSTATVGSNEYYYWLQVHGPGGTKWLHPKIRNDTIAIMPNRHPILHYFAEHPLIGLSAIAAAVLAAMAFGFFIGRKS
ncbi:hypothetical protein EUV02_07720 [Polymorphobacter arshaanensis]|uniref:Uncharacterized protein n=1 Tax=Glacieibacterium arshaanense TaxID=2511025 RepID=A0A4Y9EM26_9SPHN|nr:hypothetical protein [Polymorphobacter arshaanensis]TFU03077.1 hypothetical protein EUV02_07720 [Polymorphobacter arshaanensis]